MTECYPYWELLGIRRDNLHFGLCDQPGIGRGDPDDPWQYLLSFTTRLIYWFPESKTDMGEIEMPKNWFGI